MCVCVCVSSTNYVFTQPFKYKCIVCSSPGTLRPVTTPTEEDRGNVGGTVGMVLGLVIGIFGIILCSFSQCWFVGKSVPMGVR